MIVFCGDSFCQPDSIKWNWMNQVSFDLKTSYESLGVNAVSNFDILTQVEYAVENIDYDILIVLLTTIDRQEYEPNPSDKLEPVKYKDMRNNIFSNTLTALYREKIVTDDMLKFFMSAPLNLKKNEVYVEHMIKLCKKTDKPFLIFNNIFPVWNHENIDIDYDHKFDYIQEGPIGLMEPADFVEQYFPEISESVLDKPIPGTDRSCHLTLKQNTIWAMRVADHIRKML